MEINKQHSYNENNLRKTSSRITEKRGLYQFIQNFQKEFDEKLNFSKNKIKENQFQKNIENLNKIISKKQVSKKSGSILNNPYVFKKQIRSRSSFKSPTVNIEPTNQTKKQLNNNKRTSHRINTNFSVKLKIKNDMWELQNNNKFNSCSKEMSNFQNYYEKEKHLLKMRDAELEKLRDKKREEELKTLKDVPGICNYSLILINEKDKHKKPIHERLNQIQDQKYKKIDKMRKKIDEDYIVANNLNKLIGKDNTYNKNRFNIWISNMENWEKNKKKKIGLSKEKVENEKTTYENNLTFVPKLNKSFNGFSQTFVEEETGKKRLEKLHNDFSKRQRKYEKIQAEFTPTFKPKINQSIPNFIQSSSVHKHRSRNIYGNTSNSYITSIDNSFNHSKNQEKNVKKRFFSQSLEGKSTKLSSSLNKRTFKQEEQTITKKNTQDNISWEHNKENRLIYTPKFSDFMNSFVIEKTYKERELFEEISIQYVDSLYHSRGNLRSYNKLTV